MIQSKPRGLETSQHQQVEATKIATNRSRTSKTHMLSTQPKEPPIIDHEIELHSSEENAGSGDGGKTAVATFE